MLGLMKKQPITKGGFSRGRNVVYALHAHLVFVAKYRKCVFTPDMLADMENVMGKVCSDQGATLVEFNGEASHVHLLVHYPPWPFRAWLTLLKAYQAAIFANITLQACLESFELITYGPHLTLQEAWEVPVLMLLEATLSSKSNRFHPRLESRGFSR